MKSLKRIVKNTCRNFGVEVRGYSPNNSPTAQIVTALQRFDVDLVIDVGANRGQFAMEMRDGGYQGNIISFEPLSRAHAELLDASKNDSKWEVYARCALGSKSGEVEINIAGNSASSSLLPMLDSHVSAAPHTAYVGKEITPLRTLDEVLPDYAKVFKNPFLKIDTQGFEWEVLDGARNVLPHVLGILVELTLVPLYEGQHLWEEIIDRLRSQGFTLWAIQPGFTDPKNGRTLQVDGIFFRE